MKRLIIFSDGLWTAPALSAESNLALLAGAVATKAKDRTHQITFVDPYQALAELQPCGRRVALLRESICALYHQLAQNYAPGDSLWFFGFGRGSFVVRSCIGMIRNVGLLHKQHLHLLPDAWHIYQTRWGADAQNAVAFRQAYSAVPRIKCLGAFDTLGELGLPAPLTESNGADIPGFHDNRLSSAVDFAFHALAIDESRKEFRACPWRTAPERGQTEQCWFSGNHRDMGGVRGDPGLANIALRWMVSRVAPLGLELDKPFLEDAMYQRSTQHPEDYRASPVRKSGAKFRPIGLTNGDETLHPSAEQRFLRNSDYRPVNLKTYMQRDEQIQLPL